VRRKEEGRREGDDGGVYIGEGNEDFSKYDETR
jgi:hypothetical protein